MAVDVSSPGAPGLLLAGDAAGFVDPMTGDGLRFALRGAELAALVAAEVLAGRLAAADAAAELERRRQTAFSWEWRFNRGVRALVGADGAVRAATLAARAWPHAFEAMVRYAGDVGVAAA
jgi:flavin-dependent dehydrogenase